MIYEEVRAILKEFLMKVIGDSAVYCEHSRRRTIQSVDVVCALRKNKKKLYGFGTYL